MSRFSHLSLSLSLSLFLFPPFGSFPVIPFGDVYPLVVCYVITTSDLILSLTLTLVWPLVKMPPVKTLTWLRENLLKKGGRKEMKEKLNPYRTACFAGIRLRFIINRGWKRKALSLSSPCFSSLLFHRFLSFLLLEVSLRDTCTVDEDNMQWFLNHHRDKRRRREEKQMRKRWRNNDSSMKSREEDMRKKMLLRHLSSFKTGIDVMTATSGATTFLSRP